MDVVIRPQEAGDVDTVLDILAAVGAEGRYIGTEVPFDRDARRRELRAAAADAATGGGFMAEVDGVVAGNIGLRLAPYGVVTLGMAILDGYRGAGIGSRLLEAGIEWARARGAHKVALEVWPHNDAAIALYRKFGFVEEGLLRRHYRRRNGECWDALVVGLLLDEQ